MAAKDERIIWKKNGDNRLKYCFIYFIMLHLIGLGMHHSPAYIFQPALVKEIDHEIELKRRLRLKRSREEYEKIIGNNRTI